MHEVGGVFGARFSQIQHITLQGLTHTDCLDGYRTQLEVLVCEEPAVVNAPGSSESARYGILGTGIRGVQPEA